MSSFIRVSCPLDHDGASLQEATHIKVALAKLESLGQATLDKHAPNRELSRLRSYTGDRN